MSTSTNSKAINISLPVALVKRIDKAAKTEYATRSDYIRDSIVRKLRADEEQWETVADFTKIHKDHEGGISAEELLRHL